MKPAAASLRRRLLLAGIAGVLLAALAAAWLLGAAFERAALRALDRRLDDDLDKLIALVETLPDGRVLLNREPADERYDGVFSGWYWAVDEHGVQRASRSSWDESSLAPALAAARMQRDYSLAPGPRDQRLRVLAQQVRFPRAATPIGFAVAGDLAEVTAEARDFRVFAAFAVALIALVLLLAIAWQVAFGLRPLRRLGAILERMRHGDDVRFEVTDLPVEIAPLATQINELLDEHGRRVERARHAAHDLAHALKTPLAALALEGEAGHGAIAQRVQQEVQRMRGAIDRQLAGSLSADPRQRTAVLPVLETLCALMRRAHAERAPDIAVRGEAGLMFAGSRDDLEEMLGNLLDNACKWARSRVEVTVQRRAARLVIAIQDDGPGLDPGQADRALQRGVRLDERESGSGLGLSIVQTVASGYGGEIRLLAGEAGGLRAELELDLAPV